MEKYCKKLTFCLFVCGLSLLTYSCADNVCSEKEQNAVIVKQDSVLSDCRITQWLDGKDKAIVFTWDDMSVHSEEVAEIFDKYHKPATFYINTAGLDNIKNRIKHPFLLSMYKDFLKHGHEIGTHTKHHVNLVKVSLGEAEKEMSSSSKDIQKHFGYLPTTMSYPTSHYNSQLDSLMRLSYLDCRYTVLHDSDSLVRYIHVRSDFDFDYYKKNLDAFMSSNANLYVFGGHQLDGNGYEPMSSKTLNSLLTYIVSKYQDDCWVSTYEDVVMYRILRENVSIVNHPGIVDVKINNKVKRILSKYIHAHAYLTLCFPNVNLDISGAISYRYGEGNTYCTIDLRKSTQIKYARIDKDYKYQEIKNNVKK